MPYQEGHLKQSLLEQAAEKLRASIQFSRADPAPHNALGDVLMDAAELVVLAATGDSRSSTITPGASSSSVFGGSSPLAAAAAEQVLRLIKQAVEEGYMSALTINRTNADALVSPKVWISAAWATLHHQDHPSSGNEPDMLLVHPMYLPESGSSRLDLHSHFNVHCASCMWRESG